MRIPLHNILRVVKLKANPDPEKPIGDPWFYRLDNVL